MSAEYLVRKELVDAIGLRHLRQMFRQPFFKAPERQAALRAELESWKGTRFARRAAGGARKGVSADCVSFVAAVMLNVHAMKEFAWPQYVTFGAGEAMLELLIKTLNSIPEFGQIAYTAAFDAGNLLPGDMIVRSKEGEYHHLAIYAGQNNVFHIILKRGVCTANIHDPFINQHVKGIWRAYEPGT